MTHEQSAQLRTLGLTALEERARLSGWKPTAKTPERTMKLLAVDGGIIMRYVAAMAPDLLSLPVEEQDAGTDDTMRHLSETAWRGIRECAKLAGCRHAIVAFDSAGELRRKTLFEDYKKGRTRQTKHWQERFAAHLAEVGMMTLRWPGEEADDVIATIAARIGKSGRSMAVLSHDSDLFQLATLWCEIWQPGKKGEPKFVQRSMAWIREKYEIADLSQFVAFRALTGDSTDHLPGVAGVGPVKARKLLQHLPTEADLLASDHVPHDQFALMLKLTRLRDDIPIEPIVPSACRL